MSRRWSWEAHYIDRSILRQYDDNGTEHLFGEIKQDCLSSIWMVAKHTTPIILEWVSGRKLILFTRNTIKFVPGGIECICIWCVGYQDENTTKMFAIMPDDTIIIMDNIDTTKCL